MSHDAPRTTDREALADAQQAGVDAVAEAMLRNTGSGVDALKRENATLRGDVERLRGERDAAIQDRDTLANECHATIHTWAPVAMDYDAARLCRRYMGLPETQAEYEAALGEAAT